MKAILSIAGSDSGGCAGIQADIKTSEAFGCFSTTCITVLTAQNTTGVKDIYPIDTNFIKNQINTILSDFDIVAIKTGMLYSQEIIKTTYEILKDCNIPIVVDPVCISRSGDRLLLDDAIIAYEKLFSIATVVTPNFYEACFLLNADPKSPTNIINESNKFVKAYNTNLLIKQFPSNDQNSIDTLITNAYIQEFLSPMVHTKNNNGTGCSFSTAIACCLAKQDTLENAIQNSKDFIYNALLNTQDIGTGNGPICHHKGIK